jgi:hypothetical protein
MRDALETIGSEYHAALPYQWLTPPSTEYTFTAHLFPNEYGGDIVSETISKKPPAHEVILDRIEEAQRALRDLSGLSCIKKGARTSAASRAVSATIREHRAIALALLDTLHRMHIPKSARPEILQRLHALNAEVIGGRMRPYVQVLLEELSDDHKPSAETTTTQHEGRAT